MGLRKGQIPPGSHGYHTARNETNGKRRNFGIFNNAEEKYKKISVVKWATKKKPLTFHYTGWLIGILTMVYHNPDITG